ncbi:M20/M25/M40 family metallo-hydrolase [Govanella unica]|uniref:M20/M25/M40 family metallo-hydrolase n=1 Tax=Govanella unica TaxID=2975056 RepID=A0A9X3Z859_9PROT|nr:M20/M25/M40 family metallo-hydrolase [Govania unica]MDA5195000.1 M20/M25/M40 family metallo-hydrolase [Govania unica]
MTLRHGILVAILIALTISPANAQPTGEAEFRAIYRELVETNTTLSSGSCTLAAERMAARLKAAGFRDDDLHVLVDPGHPKEGSLVAILPGSDPDAKAILLLAHIDVVEAKREDWQRAPFTLVEEDGYFYGRGTSDDKAQAAVWVDTLARFKREGVRHQHTLKMALTCGEETVSGFNGAQDLATNHRDLIDAEFALNEGVGGLLDENGRQIVLNIQAGEKFPQDYRIEVTNAGGHSSRPTKENAIYRLADALVKLRAYDFPIQVNEVTRGYFEAMAKLQPEGAGAAMAAFAADPADAVAAKMIAETNPAWNALLRTTCVATLLDGGHATNALPQRATANVNCRILPGVSPDQVRETILAVVADPQVTVTTLKARSAIAPQPLLTERVMEPARIVAARVFPSVPFVPVMATGGTDAAFVTPAGIPTYGITGFFVGPEGSNAHGLNERMRVRSLMDGRNFLYELVKAYVGVVRDE